MDDDYNSPDNQGNQGNQGNQDDQHGWSTKINKRPNKGRNSFSRRHSHAQQHDIQPNKTTGIIKPANQLKNPTWNRYKREWIEQVSPLNEEEEEEEEDKNDDMITSQIHGVVGTGIQISRMVSRSKITPWRKEYIGPPDKSRPYWRQPSHSRRLSHFKKRGGTHKRKNKHTRRRVQRRRVRA